ncbi:MAG: TetR/AcrR family transcriptional regulator [Solirubrobacterales bacterium]|nr:TetR/AcrR family transcriptional regulator [Solirubrobacterales bacterium]
MTPAAAKTEGTARRAGGAQAGRGRTLSTADERREAVLEAAMQVFAERGYLGTPTMPIATAAGISQAYLFRLFPTKEDLVLAVIARSNRRIHDTFAKAAAAARARGEDPGEAMGNAYAELLADRTLLLTQLHAHAAAAAMPEVAAAMRTCFADLVALVERESGRDPEGVQSFFAHGMLMNVLAGIGAAGLDEHWAKVLTVCEA